MRAFDPSFFILGGLSLIVSGGIAWGWVFNQGMNLVMLPVVFMVAGLIVLLLGLHGMFSNRIG